MTLTVPKSFVRAYLRASSREQNAQRARSTLDEFANDHRVVIFNYYVENESGTRLDHPELFRLLADCQQRDILLIEDIDVSLVCPATIGKNSKTLSTSGLFA